MGLGLGLGICGTLVFPGNWPVLATLVQVILGITVPAAGICLTTGGGALGTVATFGSAISVSVPVKIPASVLSSIVCARSLLTIVGQLLPVTFLGIVVSAIIAPIAPFVSIISLISVISVRPFWPAIVSISVSAIIVVGSAIGPATIVTTVRHCKSVFEGEKMGLR